MEYNKDSFLAGIAVGRRLKGWAGGGGDGGGGGSGGVNMSLAFGKTRDLVLTGYTGQLSGLHGFIAQDRYDLQDYTGAVAEVLATYFEDSNDVVLTGYTGALVNEPALIFGTYNEEG